MMELKTREEVSRDDCWNVEALYLNFDSWEKDFRGLCGSPENAQRWPQVEVFRGKLGDGAHVLRQLFDVTLDLSRKLEKLYTYAHLRHDEDTADDAAKKAYQQAVTLLHHWSQETSWIEPEILAIDDKTLGVYMKSPELADYRFHLEKSVRMKPHTLNQKEEMLLALAGRPLSIASHAFGAFNNSDVDFGKVEDKDGKSLPLSHGSYSLYLHGYDRTLRENAFKKVMGTYESYENTLSELLAGQAHAHHFEAKARGYGSCLEAALFPKNVDTQVYHSLISTVRRNAKVLHRYVALRKRLLGVKELHLYDMYVPVTQDVDVRMAYGEGERVVIESAAPLGEEYQGILRKGLQEQRWVDRYENKNKRSGGYSSGCYDSMPYILMNYKGVMRDVFTLCHEGGHSMHSLLSRMHQPYHYSQYTIFVAEVASTFNEELLHHYLLDRAESKEHRIFLINQRIDDMRSTLFRQTMFAEFELKVHQWAEQGVPLTPNFLKKEYMELNRAYFGEGAVVDEEIAIEWARIPHFYYNFYVYQYATGISAAIALSQKVLKGGKKEREAYLGFLKGGCSKYSLDLLAGAGVDMRTPAPVEAAIATFDRLVSELDELTRGK